MFNKVLVANRGEIALRILRACKELGIETVAIHSSIDEDSLHVRYADQSVCVGSANSSDSYLNITSIISAAEITGVDAIHPGYGYLAENAEFAEICQACNIAFIGPSAHHIKLMGQKIFAIKQAKESGVPVILGSNKVVTSLEDALTIADSIGYPIMLKAVAGGGGKGVKLIETNEVLESSFDIIKTETRNAFKNDELYIEKFIKNPRHIEAQIIADQHQNVVHLGDRECSIQRRNQKLVEEAQAANMPAKVREELLESAVKIAKNIGYYSAGTVEFLMDDDYNFYFLEMNTRIQVEHPVSEYITGIDIVKEQIKVASGAELSLSQSDITFSGHSIECRINAEDPLTFLPSPGKINEINLPGGPGVRVDTAIYRGYKVSPYYDSMLAKLIVHDKSRGEAILRMKRALDEFYIEGISSTIQTCQMVLESEEFNSGRYNTYDLPKIISKATEEK
ncbi:MAG: acetyl-CoA carboxylase biotin carboxylase subunit [Nitrospinota bacterium]